MYASRIARLVLVAMMHLEARELVEEIARALVVLLLVARRRRLVERLGEAIGVARHEVVVVARVVVAELLVRDATEREAREIAHGEEALVGEDRDRLVLALRIGDLAEEVLAFVHATALDLDEPGEVGRLRPEARRLRDLGVRGERAVDVARRLLRAPAEVRDLGADLGRGGGRDDLEILQALVVGVRVERDLDDAADRATRVRTVLLPRALRRDRAAEVGARRLGDAGRRERVTEEVERGATFRRLRRRCRTSGARRSR